MTEKIVPMLFKATEHVSGPPDLSDLKLKSRRSVDNTRAQEALDKQDVVCFLEEWNYLQESLEGDAKIGLNELAIELGIFEEALKLIDSSYLDRCLIAINTLGNLQDPRAYDVIERYAANSDPVVSSWAWRALMRIDTETAVVRDLRMIAERSDWSPIFIAEVLSEMESDIISQPLCSLVKTCYEENLGERQMSRLISYLIFTHISDHTPLIEVILNESDQKEVLIACLRLVQDSSILDRVRELIRDERWEVRLQAVLTLGRAGNESDIETLIEALNDADWWVRYRAASVLLKMPTMSPQKIKKLNESLPNNFARDILRQVEAEMELSCFKPSSLALSR